MTPDERELDAELRGHLALSIHERMAQGEDPAAARIAALRELGHVGFTRESMRRVWHGRAHDLADALGHDVRHAVRSLARVRGLAITVIVTLALGIGANAAIFSVVRQVLLRPLVNRDGERLLYIRQSAPGIGTRNMMFSVPEMRDLARNVPSIAGFADFSTFDFPVVGLGEPRVVQAGVVGGSYFDVLGLRAIAGRLLDATDDGPGAKPVAVLTYRFWSTSLRRDATVVGRTIRLGSRYTQIVGVLEPSVPYPAATELIANIVASPHHLSATMVTLRTHRMTELFARLAPGATIEQARAELTAAYAAMVATHPDSYPAAGNVQLSVRQMRDQIAAPARTVLLMLLAAAGLVFAIACSNVANLILARSVRRERELAVRAAIGASRAALRRTLLAESLVLCGGGALLGVLLARPFLALVARYASRFSVLALDVTVDGTVLWTGVALALVAAVVLAFVPRLPSTSAPQALFSRTSGPRIGPATDHRLRLFAVAQISLSFILLAGAAATVTLLLRHRATSAGYDTRQVLAIDVPQALEDGPQTIGFVDTLMRRVADMPGVEAVASGNFVPWRDVTSLLPALPFAVADYTPPPGAVLRAHVRNITPGFFATLGVPLVEGRDFTADDSAGREPVVIVSRSLAEQLFPGASALGHRVWWTEPVFGKPKPRRIVGVAADVDDERVVPGPTQTIYHPFRQMPYAGRLFVRASGDPYALTGSIAAAVRALSPQQPVERAATLADVRAAVLAPERLNAFVFSGFAGIAVLVAVVGVAGVLAFTVSARTREFGVRLAVGSDPRQLLFGVLSEGAAIAALGIVAGVAGGYVAGRAAISYLPELRLPGLLPALGAAALLAGAAIVASLVPAARASRVDVVQALRSE